MPTLTAERVRELLRWDLMQTGRLYWLKDVGGCGRIKAGTVAGCETCNGYWTIRIDENLYLAHRLAWLWLYGEWPTHGIDHRDGNRTNNTWINLRLATDSENAQNRQVPRRDNSSGVAGVHWDEKNQKWRATLSVGHVRKNIGRFATLEEATIARADAVVKYHPYANRSHN